MAHPSPDFRTLVAYNRRMASEGTKTMTRYAGRELLRKVRNVDERGYGEVLCGKVWRRAYTSPSGLGLLTVFPGHGCGNDRG